jgi:hypothetical protein
MGFIIRLDDGNERYYMVWSNVVDAPITHGGTLEQLRAYIKEEHGEAGLRDLPLRLERVEKYGTSCIGVSADDAISCNRAGDDERELTREEILNAYCRPAKPKQGSDEP